MHVGAAHLRNFDDIALAGSSGKWKHLVTFAIRLQDVGAAEAGLIPNCNCTLALEKAMT